MDIQYREENDKITLNFLSGTMKARKEWNNKFQNVEIKLNHQPRNEYIPKKWDGEEGTKTYWTKNTLRE